MDHESDGLAMVDIVVFLGEAAEGVFCFVESVGADEKPG
jgi:hypothetical protein